MNTYHGGCPQCQSDWSICRPSIWHTRYGDGVDFRRAALLSQRTNGVGTKTTGGGRVQIRYFHKSEIIEDLLFFYEDPQERLWRQPHPKDHVKGTAMTFERRSAGVCGATNRLSELTLDDNSEREELRGQPYP
ncbi:hypothetical protein TNCV_3010881 [Trichonephila clavipes]|nr:hypothetical protein TNCV_3010881 [Trichonephila clavipes]